MVCEIVLAEVARYFDSLEKLQQTYDQLNIMREPLGLVIRRLSVEGTTAPFLVIHLQGPVTCTGPIAGATPMQPLSIALFLDGPVRLDGPPRQEPSEPAPWTSLDGVPVGDVTCGAGVLGCGLICLLNSWMDRRFLPRSLRPSRVANFLSIAAGLVFIALGIRGCWDHSGWIAFAILAGTLLLGWIAAWLVAKWLGRAR